MLEVEGESEWETTALTVCSHISLISSLRERLSASRTSGEKNTWAGCVLWPSSEPSVSLPLDRLVLKELCFLLWRLFFGLGLLEVVCGGSVLTPTLLSTGALSSSCIRMSVSVLSVMILKSYGMWALGR